MQFGAGCSKNYTEISVLESFRNESVVSQKRHSTLSTLRPVRRVGGLRRIKMIKNDDIPFKNEEKR